MNDLEKKLELSKKTIGLKIKIFGNENIRRSESETKIQDVILCPWSDPARLRWIELYEATNSYDEALNRLLLLYDGDLSVLKLDITYVAEVKSPQPSSSRINILLKINEFEFIQ